MRPRHLSTLAYHEPTPSCPARSSLLSRKSQNPAREVAEHLVMTATPHHAAIRMASPGLDVENKMTEPHVESFASWSLAP